jgi:hypothetical protein
MKTIHKANVGVHRAARSGRLQWERSDQPPAEDAPVERFVMRSQAISPYGRDPGQNRLPVISLWAILAPRVGFPVYRQP